jgi:hypothetical protein
MKIFINPIKIVASVKEDFSLTERTSEGKSAKQSV